MLLSTLVPVSNCSDCFFHYWLCENEPSSLLFDSTPHLYWRLNAFAQFWTKCAANNVRQIESPTHWTSLLHCPLHSARRDSWRLWKLPVRKQTLNVINCWSRSRTRWRRGGSTGMYGRKQKKKDICFNASWWSSRFTVWDWLWLRVSCRQQEAPDLFEWLCIEELRLCCPPGRFGPDCKGVRLLTDGSRL